MLVTIIIIIIWVEGAVAEWCHQIHLLEERSPRQYMDVVWKIVYWNHYDTIFKVNCYIPTIEIIILQSHDKNSISCFSSIWTEFDPGAGTLVEIIDE